MKLAWIAFSERGEKLGRFLADVLGGSVVRGGRDVSLKDWTKARFAVEDGLIFIGACGIAVRAVAPYLESKTTDPAVVVLDENGQFCISLLSGHLGGANDLTRHIAALCGATPVITTATDSNGLFAVDEWARRQGCVIRNPERIKSVSSKLLAGGHIRILSDWEIAGEAPARVEYYLADRMDGVATEPDVRLSMRYAQNRMGGVVTEPDVHLSMRYAQNRMDGVVTEPDVRLSMRYAQNRMDGVVTEPDVRLSMRSAQIQALQVVPRLLVLGVGCRRGTYKEALDRFFKGLMETAGLLPEAVCRICSIDLKADEPGLVAFCAEKGLSLTTFTSEELNAVEGIFTASAFVKDTVGVDNVCERSAVLGSGGRLILRKTAGNGITMALAERPFAPDWRWTYE